MSKLPIFHNCPICFKTFLKHNDSKGTYCSKKCCVDGRRKIFQENTNQRRILKETNYNNNPKLCIGCNTIIPFEKRINKFCCHSCSAQIGNIGRIHSIEHRQKTSKSLTSKPKTGIKEPKTGIKEPKTGNKTFCEIIYQTCVECNNIFILKKQKYPKKCCSLSCRKLSYSRAGKNSAKVKCLRSKDEIQLYNLCVTYYKKVDNNLIIKDGWDADIILNEQKIAILWNGPWHYKDMKMTNHSLLQVQTRDKIKINVLTKAGWKVIVFEDRYYTPKSAFEELKLMVDPVGYDPTTSPL